MRPIQIIEVGPRDGLQNEETFVPTDVKRAFVEALSLAGLGEIEVSAFVSPRWVPQLADAEAVFAGLRRTDGIVYSALVPNRRGLERAVAVGVDKVSVVVAASESFNRRNVGADVGATLAECREVVAQSPVPVRGYVSTAFHCPFEGPVAGEAVLRVVGDLLEAGCVEISVGDTIGRATPEEVEQLLELLLARHDPTRFAMHMHDTGGGAVDNCLRAAELGVERFDSCVGGLGGCPYAPGKHGNVATEALVRAFEGRTGVDPQALRRALALVSPSVGARRVI